jgi:hypothetical protein
MSVYYVHAPELGMVKIGFAGDVARRFYSIQTHSPTRLTLLAIEDGDLATEAARHAQFASLRHRGEWFKFEGALVDFVQTLTPAPVKQPSLNQQLIAIGISKAYASQILNGGMNPPINLAIRIFRETGWRHGRITALSEYEMQVFERHDPWAPTGERAVA